MIRRATSFARINEAYYGVATILFQLWELGMGSKWTLVCSGNVVSPPVIPQ